MNTLVFALLAISQVPANWECDDALYDDGASCDCGCAALDPDCETIEFNDCDADHCALGQVPWEHENRSCMASACGDGWLDAASGEVCDDFGGTGCSSDCTTVDEGYACGPRADGCDLSRRSVRARVKVKERAKEKVKARVKVKERRGRGRGRR